MKFFENLHMVLVVGLILALALLYGTGHAPQPETLFRWLHVFFGITWIGLLYYFNFVQVPTMPKVPAELKRGVSGYIAPSALFFFRWAAVFTVLTGLVIAHLNHYLAEALTFKPGFQLIGLGMWLAIIMFFNVWVLIWPNQKKVLGLVEADDASKAKAGRIALAASRTNTLLSLPMLVAMATFAQNPW
jgi:uncharacterized membrane protein